MVHALSDLDLSKMTFSDLCPKYCVCSIMINFWWNVNFLNKEMLKYALSDLELSKISLRDFGPQAVDSRNI
jgi:hypothetical protein